MHTKKTRFCPLLRSRVRGGRKYSDEPIFIVSDADTGHIQVSVPTKHVLSVATFATAAAASTDEPTLTMSDADTARLSPCHARQDGHPTG